MHPLRGKMWRWNTRPCHCTKRLLPVPKWHSRWCKKSKETIRHLVDESKSILSLILSKRPAYPISHEVFLFIVKELLLVKGQIIGKQKNFLFSPARTNHNTVFVMLFVFCVCFSQRIQISFVPNGVIWFNRMIQLSFMRSIVSWWIIMNMWIFSRMDILPRDDSLWTLRAWKVSKLLMQYVYLHKTICPPWILWIP